MAVLVEGQDEVQVLSVDHTSRKLSLLQRLTLSGVRFPVEATFDGKDRLWVVGGAPLDTSTSIHIGVAKRAGEFRTGMCMYSGMLKAYKYFQLNVLSNRFWIKISCLHYYTYK